MQANRSNGVAVLVYLTGTSKMRMASVKRRQMSHTGTRIIRGNWLLPHGSWRERTIVNLVQGKS